MAITGIILTDAQCTYGADDKELRFEWLVFSDSAADMPIHIAEQGITENMLAPDGSANGWLAPGTACMFAEQEYADAVAGPVEVTDRKIIGGQGDFEIIINGLAGISIIPIFNQCPKIRYKVRQQYSSLYKAEEPNQYPASVKLSYEWEELPFVHDMVNFNIPVINSAGQYFNPPATRRRKIPVYTITRRERNAPGYGNPIDKAIDYSNKVNFDEFSGRPPGTLLMDSITCDYNYGDDAIWTVTYTIKEKVEGWETYILDTGFFYRGPDGFLYPILYDDGTPVAEPAKLDGLGMELPDQSALGVNRGPFCKWPGTLFEPLLLPDLRYIGSLMLPTPIQDE